MGPIARRRRRLPVRPREEAGVVELAVLDDVAVMRLNRPRVHGAIDAAVMDELERSLDVLDRTPSARAVVVTGAGRESFCAGGDLRYFARLRTRAQGEAMSRRMQRILARLASGPRVSVAAVNGRALGGGCELVLACHWRVAASHATFAFRQVPNGLVTGWGGGVRLLAAVGRSQAMRLLLTGEEIRAPEALRIGLVDEVVDADAIQDAALAAARRLVAHPEGAVRAMLELVRAWDEARDAGLVELETRLFADRWTSPEWRRVLARFGGRGPLRRGGRR
jgi:enoyl-CoA hydratase/carnithine racemase